MTRNPPNCPCCVDLLLLDVIVQRVQSELSQQVSSLQSEGQVSRGTHTLHDLGSIR